MQTIHADNRRGSAQDALERDLLDLFQQLPDHVKEHVIEAVDGFAKGVPLPSASELLFNLGDKE